MLRNFFQAIREQLQSAFRYGPLEIALCFAVTLYFSYAVSVSNVYNDGIRSADPWEGWAKFAIGVAIALPLVFSASYLRIDGRITPVVRWALSGVAVVGGLAIGQFLGQDTGFDFWRMVSLIGASTAVMMIAPGLARVDRSAQHRYATQHIGRAFLMLVYCMLLYGGLAGAIAAVQVLFSLPLSSEVFSHLAGLTFFALYPALIVGGMERLAAESHIEDEPPFAAIQAARFLLAPLLLIYLLILYVYLLRVLLSGEWPHNMISPLALAAAGIGVTGQILVGSVITQEQYRGVSLIFRGFSFAIVVPLLMSLTAVVMRLNQYGFTPARYAIVLLFVAFLIVAVVGIVRAIRNEAPPLFTVGATAAAIMLLSCVGPLSVKNVVDTSQARQARVNAAELGLYVDGKFLDAEAMTARVEELQRELESQRAARDEDDYEELALEITAGHLHSALSTAADFSGDRGIRRKLSIDATQTQAMTHLFGAWDRWSVGRSTESYWRHLEGDSNTLIGMPAGDIHIVSVYRVDAFERSALENSENVQAIAVDGGSKLLVARGTTVLASFELRDVLATMLDQSGESDMGVFEPTVGVLRADGIEVRIRSLMFDVSYEVSPDEPDKEGTPVDYSLNNAEIVVVLSPMLGRSVETPEGDVPTDGATPVEGDALEGADAPTDAVPADAPAPAPASAD